MTKTQIQLPDELYTEVKKFAKQREWSLAETFRRGVELLLQTYPESAQPASTSWEPPSSDAVGWKGLSADELDRLAFEDQCRTEKLQ